MKNLNRILGLGLSAALLAGGLAGCAKDPAGTADPTGSPNPTATSTAGPAGEAPLVETEDVIQKLLGLDRNATMFTVDGKAVTAEQLYYWVGYTVDSVGYYSFGSADAIDWTQEQEGKSIGQYIVESAKQTAQLYALMEIKATEAGIVLTEKDKADLNTQVVASIEQLGGEEEYGKWLQQIGMSDEAFRHMYSVSYLYNGLKESLYGEESGNAPTGEEIVAKAEADGKLLAKHILIKTQDDAGADLPEAEMTAAKQKADDLLAQLRAAAPAEQEALFDTLMNENSEDGRNPDGTLGAPDGYLFGAGEMVQEFEDATKALEYNEISDPVKSDFGYHIILRLTPDNAELRTAWVEEKMNDQVDGWMTAAVVEDAPELAQVDPQSFYEKLAAYRASLEPAPEATPAPTETGTPAPTETGTPAPTETPAAGK